MVSAKVTISADVTNLSARLNTTLTGFKTRKMAYLWRPLAARMARIYDVMFRMNWPHLPALSPDYVAWKRMRGYNVGKLDMTGNLKDTLTDPSKIIDRGTNEHNLRIGPRDVTTNVTGRGAPRAPMKYPNAVYDGFVAKYPYGFRQNSPRAVPGRNFLWRDTWSVAVENVAEEFAFKIMTDSFGREKVRKVASE